MAMWAQTENMSRPVLRLQLKLIKEEQMKRKQIYKLYHGRDHLNH